jgi:hypothetical protein
MTDATMDDLLACLGRVAEREERRAVSEFEARHGRVYDGGSDEDWDDLDKDHAGVGMAMDVVRGMRSA